MLLTGGVAAGMVELMSGKQALVNVSGGGWIELDYF